MSLQAQIEERQKFDDAEICGDDAWVNVSVA